MTKLDQVLEGLKKIGFKVMKREAIPAYFRYFDKVDLILDDKLGFKVEYHKDGNFKFLISWLDREVIDEWIGIVNRIHAVLK